MIDTFNQIWLLICQCHFWCTLSLHMYIYIWIHIISFNLNIHICIDTFTYRVHQVVCWLHLLIPSTPFGPWSPLGCWEESQKSGRGALSLTQDMDPLKRTHSKLTPGFFMGRRWLPKGNDESSSNPLFFWDNKNLKFLTYFHLKITGFLKMFSLLGARPSLQAASTPFC